MTKTYLMAVCAVCLLWTRGMAETDNALKPGQNKKEIRKKSHQLYREGWTVYGQQLALTDALADINRLTDEGMVQITGFGQADSEAQAVRKATMHANRQLASIGGTSTHGTTRTETTADGGETLRTGSVANTVQKVKPLKPVLCLTRQLTNGTVEAQVFCLTKADNNKNKVKP